MSRSSFPRLAVAGLAAAAFIACSDDEPAGPTAASTTAGAAAADHMSPHTGSANVEVAATPAPFTLRASLEPYRIHQLPDFMMHSKATTDIVMQRQVFNPGAGMWHTHPGPSFVYVLEGEIKLQRASEKGECTETPVAVVGDAYFEIANEVHRAVVVSAEPAVVMVTRFNIPVGQPITSPAADPGC